MKPLLLYIHGFNSSPSSHKAKVMAAVIKDYRPDIELLQPQLPSYPAQAIQYLEQLLKAHMQLNPLRPLGLVGSSLGGYFATYLADKYQCKAVLINPAVKPYLLLSDYLGHGENSYSGERFFLEKKHVLELALLETVNLNAHLFWVLLQTGDEVLDYQQAVLKYDHALITMEQGGNHHFVDFERYPRQIIDFLQL